MEETNAINARPIAPRGLMEQVREGAASQLSTQKDRATDGLGALAQAVRHSTQTLRDNQQDTVADFVERAADQIERVSTRLRDKDVPHLLQDAQLFARRQPAVFIGAAFVAGVLAARFLKSTGTDSQDARPARSGY